MSWSSRFSGALTADLRKIHANLVPFKNCHFLVSSIVNGDHLSVADMTWKGINPGNHSLSVTRGNRYLTTLLAYKGTSIEPSEVDDVSVMLQKNGSEMDPFYPDWIPNSVCASISQGTSRSLLSVFNTTAAHEFLDRTIANFIKQFKSKSNLHAFEENGVHSEEMLEALNLVEYVSQQYKEYARYPDKIVKIDKSGKRVINDSQSLHVSNEQRQIAHELLL